MRAGSEHDLTGAAAAAIEKLSVMGRAGQAPVECDYKEPGRLGCKREAQLRAFLHGYSEQASFMVRLKAPRARMPGCYCVGDAYES